MASSTEAADRLFRLGEYAELLRLTDCSPTGLKALDSRHRIVVAQALALTGNDQAASEIADAIETTPAPERIRALARMVRGLVAASQGHTFNALEHLRTALKMAKEARDFDSVAWIHVRLFRFMIESHPADALSALLPQVRRSTLRAGNVHATAYLHNCVAVLEGQAGRSREALRHCAISESLVSTFPNAWLTTGNLFNRGCIAVVECDLDMASRFLADSRIAAAKSTIALGEARADHALGHVQMLKGAFGEAAELLGMALKSKAISHLTRLAALDGLARACLAQERLDECGRLLDRLEQAGAWSAGSSTNYHIRWAAITRARLYLKKGDARRAVEHLREAEAGAIGSKDLPFQCALHLTAAQALVRDGDAVEGARRVAAATRLGVSGFRELLGTFYLASSEVAADAEVANLLADRARRVWASQGIVSIPLEMHSARPAAAPPLLPPPTSKAAGVSIGVVERLAGAIDLAYSPPLFGHEMLAAARNLGSTRAEIVETRGSAPAPAATDGQAVLTLGATRTRNGQLHLVCPFPDDPSRILSLTSVLRIGRTALEAESARQEQRERAALWPADPLESDGSGLFIAEEMQALLATVRKIATTPIPVLITGETGTGKEVMARAVHSYSNRAKSPFLPFNCTSTPRDMLDSQLFGHRRGSFTGASEHFPGIIRGASGGTLFLDEIGDMSLDVQPKLLRFLESGEIHPVGEAHPVKTDVRIIAATNADLDTLIAEGRFRADLFYRLNIVRLQIPPLRERRVEIPSLARYYLEKHSREWGKGDLRLSEEAMEYLTLYRWPGNVRQLANQMRRVVAMAEPGSVVTPQYLSPEVLASRRTVPASERQLESSELVVRLDQTMAAATEQVERRMLEFALERCNGRIEETAEMLGLSRKGLYLKRHRFGIEPPPAALSASAEQ